MRQFPNWQTIHPQIKSIRASVEEVDDDLVTGLEKLQNKLVDSLDRMDEKLGDIHGVLEEIRDLLKKR